MNNGGQMPDETTADEVTILREGGLSEKEIAEVQAWRKLVTSTCESLLIESENEIRTEIEAGRNGTRGKIRNAFEPCKPDPLLEIIRGATGEKDGEIHYLWGNRDAHLEYCNNPDYIETQECKAMEALLEEVRGFKGFPRRIDMKKSETIDNVNKFLKILAKIVENDYVLERGYFNLNREQKEEIQRIKAEILQIAKKVQLARKKTYWVIGDVIRTGVIRSRHEHLHMNIYEKLLEILIYEITARLKQVADIVLPATDQAPVATTHNQ